MTMTDRSTVVGVFELRSQADAAIYELQHAGFSDDQIGFIVRNEDESVTTPLENEDTTEKGPGAATGAVSGGIIGGIVGAAAALLIPGIGPAIAGGILVAVLGGAAIGAAAGGIVGALIGMGVPEEEAHYYEGEFHSGRTLVTVRADGRQQEAIDILHRNGGYDAGTRLGQTQAPTYGSTVNSNMYNSDAQRDQVAAGRPAANPGTYNANTQSDQMLEPGSGTTSNASPRRYDPVAGVTQEENQAATVRSGEYGLQRDPTVETDATAGTTDTNVRPDTPVESDFKGGLYERPIEPGIAEPGITEPGVTQNPDDQLPRNL